MILDMSNASIKCKSLAKKKRKKEKEKKLWGDTSRHTQCTDKNHSNINNEE